MGLLNTNDKNGFFRLKATIGSETFKISSVDWKSTFHKQFNFKGPDSKLSFEQVNLLSINEIILYQVDRFDLVHCRWQECYAYAVQPLFILIEGERMLIKGQFQLPLF